MRDVLETVYRLTGKENDFKDILKAMKGKETTGEIDFQYMGFDKVNEHFGWFPEHPLEKGVIKTIEWFEGYLKDKYAP